MNKSIIYKETEENQIILASMYANKETRFNKRSGVLEYVMKHYNGSFDIRALCVNKEGIRCSGMTLNSKFDEREGFIFWQFASGWEVKNFDRIMNNHAEIYEVLKENYSFLRD